ncbi:class E sortase [Streptomyces sp. NPDC059816]|uniref:class E sortase n=1 Tax=Streptomyces sp. NPDC059816 TaxID=3346960 RepID=UPI00364AB2A1
MTAVRPERDSGPRDPGSPPPPGPTAPYQDPAYGPLPYEVPGGFERAVQGLADPLNDPLPGQDPPAGWQPGAPGPGGAARHAPGMPGEWYDPQGYARNWHGPTTGAATQPPPPAPVGPTGPYGPAGPHGYGDGSGRGGAGYAGSGGPPYASPPPDGRHRQTPHPPPAPAAQGVPYRAPAANAYPTGPTGPTGPSTVGPGPLPPERPGPHGGPSRPYPPPAGTYRPPGPGPGSAAATARPGAAGGAGPTGTPPHGSAVFTGPSDVLQGPRPGRRPRGADDAYDHYAGANDRAGSGDFDVSPKYPEGTADDADGAPLSRVEARRAARARKPTVGVLVSRGLGEIFITVGLLMLLFVTYQLWWTNIRAQAQADGAANQIQEDWAKGKRAPGSFEPGQGFALMHIPTLDVVVPVAEGIDKKKVLDRGMVGHYAEGSLKTGMPEDKTGNFAVAGHRNTHGEPFRYINRLKPGDPIVVETQDTYFVYEMASILQQTPPSNVAVLEPIPPGSGFTAPGRYLTLTTCTPEFTSKYRMIVWGKMAEERPRSEGKPDALVS